MSKIFITGASGFLGSEIIRHAVAQGHHVLALKRATSDVRSLADLPIEWVVGDVCDLASLELGMRGCQYVIHTAGDTSYFIKDRARLERVNVEGVRNIVSAARSAGIKRLVHTSSVAAVGFDPNGNESDETTQWNWPSGLPYMETKRDGERVALAAAGKTLEVIVLNPATILGPGKMNASEEQMLREIREQKVPGVPTGGMTVCDVTDVAAAHLLALTRGASGQRYILGGTSITHRDLFATIASAYRVNSPKRTMPKWLLAAAGNMLLICERARFPVTTPSAVVRLARFGIYHSSEKAKRDLGYRPRPLAEMIERATQGRDHQ